MIKSKNMLASFVVVLFNVLLLQEQVNASSSSSTRSNTVKNKKSLSFNQQMHNGKLLDLSDPLGQYGDPYEYDKIYGGGKTLDDESGSSTTINQEAQHPQPALSPDKVKTTDHVVGATQGLEIQQQPPVVPPPHVLSSTASTHGNDVHHLNRKSVNTNARTTSDSYVPWEDDGSVGSGGSSIGDKSVNTAGSSYSGGNAYFNLPIENIPPVVAQVTQQVAATRKEDTATSPGLLVKASDGDTMIRSNGAGRVMGGSKSNTSLELLDTIQEGNQESSDNGSSNGPEEELSQSAYGGDDEASTPGNRETSDLFWNEKPLYGKLEQKFQTTTTVDTIVPEAKTGDDVDLSEDNRSNIFTNSIPSTADVIVHPEEDQQVVDTGTSLIISSNGGDEGELSSFSSEAKDPSQVKMPDRTLQSPVNHIERTSSGSGSNKIPSSISVASGSTSHSRGAGTIDSSNTRGGYSINPRPKVVVRGGISPGGGGRSIAADSTASNTSKSGRSIASNYPSDRTNQSVREHVQRIRGGSGSLSNTVARKTSKNGLTRRENVMSNDPLALFRPKK